MKFGLIKKPAFERIDDRGRFIELLNQHSWESLIIGNMKNGAEMGHHYHNHTILYFYLLSGVVHIKTLNLKNNKKLEYDLKQGQAFIFKPEEVRVITYKTNSQFIILKSPRYDPNNPDLIDYPKDF